MMKRAQGTALPRQPHPPGCSRFSGSSILPKAESALSPSPHAGSDPVK